MQIYLSLMSLFPRGLRFFIESAETAGFNGIEVFNFQFSKKKIRNSADLAKKIGLNVHFHQAWPYEDDPTWINWLLNKLGFLPPLGLDAKIQFEGIDEPVVVCPDEWRDAVGRKNFWTQTNLSHGPKGMKMSLSDFIDIVKRYKLSVVFDTQHYLEDCFRKNGVEFISSDKEILLDLLAKSWEQLGPYTKEIHLCDFNPKLGNQKGRNLFLGEGIFPLEGFADMVKKSGWNGTIIPEVKSQHILRLRRIDTLKSLVKLRRTVEDIFKI